MKFNDRGYWLTTDLFMIGDGFAWIFLPCGLDLTIHWRGSSNNPLNPARLTLTCYSGLFQGDGGEEFEIEARLEALGVDLKAELR